MKRIKAYNLRYWCSKPGLYCDGLENAQPCISLLERTLCPWLVIGVTKEVTIAVMDERRYVEVQDDLVSREMTSDEVRRIVEFGGVDNV